MCFLPDGQKVVEGIYAGICFDGKGRGALAGCLTSVTRQTQEVATVTRSAEARRRIDVGNFNHAFVNPEEILSSSFDPKLAIEQIIKSLAAANSLLGMKSENVRVETPSLFAMVANESSFARPLIGSLTKPFLILTGNSGTGKTRLAELIAATYRNREEVKSATNVALVPVGADWTDSRAVLGFVNHLRETALEGIAEKRPVYQSTAVVDLLLAADADSDHPHFLILDEMNLSHVERYFADFLSAMESRDGRIRFHDEGPRDQDDFRLPRFEGDPVGVPRSITYPRNLFVTGTVNIDETTYMFSPKVLDRAHVIEFLVDRQDIATFLENPVAPELAKRAPDAQAKAFLQLALDARDSKLSELPGVVSKSVNGHLMEWLELLQLGRFEFAYRTANEVQRYLRVCHHLAKDKAVWAVEERLSSADRKAGKGNWLSDLDDEILQKVLPRLHGSRNRIGPLLGALASYAHSGEMNSAKGYFPEEGSEIAEKSIGDPDFASLKDTAALFPRSFSKLKTMARVLVEEQFVSFIC